MKQNVSNITKYDGKLITSDGFNGKDIILIFFYSFMIPLGLIGNGLTIRYFRFTPKWKEAGTKLLVVLAVNDLVSSLYVPLEKNHFIVQYVLSGYSNTWIFGKLLCYLTVGLSDMLFVVTSWMLVAVAAERYR